MKVIYLIDSLEGYGAEKSIVQIAVNMRKVVPVFIHLYPGDKLKSRLVEAGIKVYSLNINSSYGYEEALKTIPDIINKEKPDILHSTLFRADMVARKLKKLFPDIPLIGSLVSNSYGKKRYSEMSYFSQLKLFTTQCKDRFTAHHVDYFICNSKAIKKTNIRALGIPESKIKVIYRGRSFDDYHLSPPQIDKISAQLNPGNKKVFLNVGRLIKSKGQLDLLYAFKDLLVKSPQCLLYIAGEGPLRPQLERQISALDLQQNVILLGYREDIPELLSLCNFFIFPSYFEGLPGALIEAIIAKKPAIVSDIPENRECFEDDNVLYFQPGNIKEMKIMMEKALNVKDWDDKVEETYHYAEANFKIENISKEYEEFYANILSEH